MSPLPWLDAAQERLRSAHRAGRTPHGLLIHEAPGTGGSILASWFSQLVLCPVQPAPCGQCASCRRIESREHPDFITLGPDAESKLGQITVDQVRAVSEQLSLSSYEGRGTVVVIEPAHALNRNASNALLKTLEEPRRDAHLVLVTSSPRPCAAVALRSASRSPTASRSSRGSRPRSRSTARTGPRCSRYSASRRWRPHGPTCRA